MWHVGFCSLSYHEAGAELQEDYNEAFSAQPVQSTTNIKLFFDVCRLAAQEPGCEGLAGGLRAAAVSLSGTAACPVVSERSFHLLGCMAHGESSVQYP